ncbi:MAG TPA: hypothetical protein DEB06_01375 [Phycisphaerales bacterium]|nr:hypothetical protein [Phycisphaerales bacterium]
MRLSIGLAAVCAAALSAAAPAFAGFDEFISFDESPLGTLVNGLTIKNATFGFSAGIGRGLAGSERVGPDATIAQTLTSLNTSGPGIVGPDVGRLVVKFGVPVTGLGFGFAVESFTTVEGAIAVDLFDPEGKFLARRVSDAIGIGDRGVAYASNMFTAGGIGDIGSIVIEFPGLNPVDSTEERSQFTAFSIDGLGYNFGDLRPVPLPSAALLGGAGLMAIGGVRRRR